MPLFAPRPSLPRRLCVGGPVRSSSASPLARLPMFTVLVSSLVPLGLSEWRVTLTAGTGAVLYVTHVRARTRAVAAAQAQALAARAAALAAAA